MRSTIMQYRKQLSIKFLKNSVSKTVIVALLLSLSLFSIQFMVQDAQATSTSTRPGKYNVIYLGSVGSEATNEAEYATLAANPAVNPSLRAYSPDQASLWQSKQMHYYYTVAASDYTSCSGTPSPYVSQSAGDSVLAGSYNDGLYIHELVSLYAACNGWDWTAAANAINWDLLNTWVTNAHAQGKKVIWSEPSHGWSSLGANATAAAYLNSATWRATIVPMYGTNFTTPTNDVPLAQAGALAASAKYSLPLGVSLQSWHWRDKNASFTSNDVVSLAADGHAAGATYYQIEGTPGDMETSSVYMQGINAFAAGLVGDAPPAPVPPTTPAEPAPAPVQTPAPTPAATATPPAQSAPAVSAAPAAQAVGATVAAPQGQQNAPAPTAAPPQTPAITPAATLVNTGPGDLVGLFCLIVLAGTVAHHVYLRRHHVVHVSAL